MSAARMHTLSRGRGFLEAAATVFEALGERGLCDDLSQLIEQANERVDAEQEGEAA